MVAAVFIERPCVHDCHGPENVTGETVPVGHNMPRTDSVTSRDNLWQEDWDNES